MGNIRLLCLLLMSAFTGPVVQAMSMEDLSQLVLSGSDELCDMIQCETPLQLQDCPTGSSWMDNVAMSGCCGACVQFKKVGESGCTGKVEEHECCLDNNRQHVLKRGYGTCSQCPTSTSRNKIRYESSSLLSDHTDVAHVSRYGISMMPSMEKVSNVLNSSWCDYGMYCGKMSSDDTECLVFTDVSSCITSQQSYDRDMNSNDSYVAYRDDFRWRPECQLDGDYAPKQCKGPSQESIKTCVCVDPQGNSIQGKAFNFQGALFDDMNCLCSRRIYELSQQGMTDITLHCRENGNYEPLQCQGGWCYCVHPENGSIWGYQMPESGMEFLPCFNRSNFGDMYLRRCDSMYHARTVFLDTMKQKGISIGPGSEQTCDYDGSFGPTKRTTNSFTCLNKYGADCKVGGETDCECVRDMLTYSEYGQDYVLLTCKGQSGSYESWQVWPSQQAGYYVDNQGIRISSVTRLNCSDYLRESEFKQCQSVGNVGPDGHCNVMCSNSFNTDQRCPPNAYLYSEQYFMDADCMATSKT